MQLFARLAVAALLLAVGGSAVSAGALSNTTPGSSAGVSNDVTAPDDFKPPECAGIILTHLQTGGGVMIGIGNRNELTLGSAGVDDIRGMLGSDCIVAAASDDSLDGGRPPGSDVCIGGGDAGDTFTACETVIP